MGTGKTVVGREVALLLGREFVDTDDFIETRVGIPISRIFADQGESQFRKMEKELCFELAQSENLVVSTGGGTLMDEDNRNLMTVSVIVIRLKCSRTKILDRIGNAEDRPLLNCADPEARIDALLRVREPIYSALPFHVDTTALAVDEVVQAVHKIFKKVNVSSRFISVSSPGSGGYTIAIGPDLLENVGEMLRSRDLSSTLAVVTDETVAGIYLETVLESLHSGGFKAFPIVIPAGESSKSLSKLEKLYTEFIEHGLDRRSAVLALGGGVVGDLAGFAAATYMRGVHFVQCPTTLLAMVDSSVGGKTGVDLKHGKNLVGAFKQPLLVVADTNCLKSLPIKEIRMGMAELIKHTIIDDADLFERLEQSTPALLNAEQVSRSVNVKVRVVEKDPFESGLREVLNLGHTVGHAIEKLSHYSMAHGDAVSIGLAAAGRISNKSGMCTELIPRRIEDLLAKMGLPVNHHMESESLIEAMKADKKTVEGRIRFVLIRDLGNVVNGCEVPDILVKNVLDELRSTGK
jgi:3-dehydroquinate synthase